MEISQTKAQQMSYLIFNVIFIIEFMMHLASFLLVIIVEL